MDMPLLTCALIEKEVIELVFDMLLVIGTGYISHFVLAEWEFQKKMREMDLLLAQQFQQHFGEFKEVWRLWKLRGRVPSNPEALVGQAARAEAGLEAIMLKLTTDRSLTPAQTRTLGLFRQAFQLLRKSIVEAAPRLYMTENEGKESVAQRKEAVQKAAAQEAADDQLKDSKQDQDYHRPWYHAFNQLACEVSCIVTGENESYWQQLSRQLGRGRPRGLHQRPAAEDASAAFARIHRIREADWYQEIGQPKWQKQAAVTSAAQE